MLKQKEWIDVIVTKTGCTKKEAKLIYDCMFEYIKEQISEDSPIKLQGLGVFKLRKTAAKEQINLVTGQAEIVPEHYAVTFKPYFEIDPKPEAIEVEDEEVIEVVEEVIPAVEEEVVEEAVHVEEEVVEEEVVEEVVPVEEEVVEEVVPVEEEVIEEVNDNFVWVYGNEKLTTKQVLELICKSTSLSKEEVNSALDVVKANMEKINKTTCDVKETNETFDFIIEK